MPKIFVYGTLKKGQINHHLLCGPRGSSRIAIIPSLFAGKQPVVIYIIYKKLVKIGETAKLLGTTPDTLCKGEGTGELLSKQKPEGGTWYYEVAEWLNLGNEDAPTVCYTVFSARLNGSRSHKNQQFIDKLDKAVADLTEEDATRPPN